MELLETPLSHKMSKDQKKIVCGCCQKRGLQPNELTGISDLCYGLLDYKGLKVWLGNYT